MGTDIHAYVINKRTNEYVPILTGGYRNYDFFNKLQGRIDVMDVDVLPLGVNDYFYDNLPKGIKDAREAVGGGYGLEFMSVQLFNIWCLNNKPEKDAGWCTKYEAWLYRTRRIVPELYHALDRDDIIQDMEFIEVTDEYSPWKLLSKEIWNVLTDKKWQDTECILCYFFDN